MLSMTGFGRGHAEVAGGRFEVDVRSVNHRYLDVKVRLPAEDVELEAQVAAAVRRRLERGAVTVQVRAAAGTPTFFVDRDLARRTYQSLAEIARDVGAPPPPLDAILSLPEVVRVGVPALSGRALFQALEPALAAALDGMTEMRRREGEALAADMERRRQHLAAIVRRLRTIATDAPAELRRRLSSRLAATDLAVDPARLAQEVALLAERADVAEELTRLDSHLEQLAVRFAAAGAIGRTVDFLIQEVNRELSTVAAKSQNAEVATLVVEARAELERMREQAQNIE